MVWIYWNNVCKETAHILDIPLSSLLEAICTLRITWLISGADPDQKLTGFWTQQETATLYPTHLENCVNSRKRLQTGLDLKE